MHPFTTTQVVISLSDAAFQSLSLVQDLHTAVTGAIRRFDGSQVQLYWCVARAAALLGASASLSPPCPSLHRMAATTRG